MIYRDIAHKLFSLRGAADPISDASSVEASGFELKFSKALNYRKISEKLFEASWLDINAAQQRKKEERKEREGRNGKEGKGRERKEIIRKVKRKKEDKNNSDSVRHCAKYVENATLP